MYVYRAVRQELSTPETGPYTTFGILALRLEAGQWQKALSRMCQLPAALPPTWLTAVPQASLTRAS